MGESKDPEWLRRLSMMQFFDHRKRILRSVPDNRRTLDYIYEDHHWLIWKDIRGEIPLFENTAYEQRPLRSHQIESRVVQGMSCRDGRWYEKLDYLPGRERLVTDQKGRPF